jgi:peptidyl-prolyl cis-trans isomerase C
VESFYKENRQNFRRPDTFHAAHIVKEVNDLQTAEQAEAGIKLALAELDGGDEFTEIADRHSDCKGNGGDLGTFKAGFMVDDFENAIRALEPGQRTGIFTTRFGFHVAKLYSKSIGEVMELGEVRGDIEGYFRARSREQLVMAGVANMRAAAKIRFEPDEPAPEK